MPEPLRLKGISASAGYAEGPLFNLDRGCRLLRRQGERRRREGRTGGGDRHGDGPACDADRDRRRGGRRDPRISDRHAGGRRADRPGLCARSPTAQPADAAWRRALDAEIAGYEASDQDYFRARAADLRDIRDQVLRALTEEGEIAAPAGRHPLRRRHRADAFSGNRLELRRRHRAESGQCGQPCRHAGALARRADGRGAWCFTGRSCRHSTARRRAWRHRASAVAGRDRSLPRSVIVLCGTPRQGGNLSGGDRQ